MESQWKLLDTRFAVDPSRCCTLPPTFGSMIHALLDMTRSRDYTISSSRVSTREQAGNSHKADLADTAVAANPYGTTWGNMSWGHLTSRDMFTWKLHTNSIALAPDQPYDREGVFTGCWVPPTREDDPKLRVIYSSVRQLPFHWSTPPYPRAAAGLSIAVSTDNGTTWSKGNVNPVLAAEPQGLNVTGFRDPYLSEWASLDRLLGKTQPSLYGLVSGGIQGRGPTSFLYEVDPDQPETWQYRGPLVDVPEQFEPSPKWTGSFGMNWECVNFMTLSNRGESREFLIIGAEGAAEKAHVSLWARPQSIAPRTVRSQQWMCGDFVLESGIPRFQYGFGGSLDHGLFYAANSFFDPVSGRRIMYGWIPEEDIPAQLAHEKGWNGALAFPRELFALRIPNVHKALRTDLSMLGCYERLRQPDGTLDLLTLGVRPIEEFARLRARCTRVQDFGSTVELPEFDGSTQRSITEATSNTWELETVVSLQDGCEEVGIILAHADDLDRRTTITFCLRNEAITVDRQYSNSSEVINKCPEAGPFTLFTTSNAQPGSSPATESAALERMHLRLIADHDILEVFANDRFALTTMLYRDSFGGGHDKMTAFATGPSGAAAFEKIVLHDGLTRTDGQRYGSS